jgi:hypothetical protein
MCVVGMGDVSVVSKREVSRWSCKRRCGINITKNEERREGRTKSQVPPVWGEWGV